ncbi:uncharacterized protein LOC125758704 [Rhipicephalus sanguineus]|uniref:uncharacterized protein LOC125758704 n=1 Tax=Rhipicephalus sanguineus TaxID=34632 RepID=UPI0020C1CBFB|nr:uncharacterized protein LOC125758704 [Rhipicephalus sanguineus]
MLLLCVFLLLLWHPGSSDHTFPFFGSVAVVPALKTLVPTGTPLIGSNIGVAIPFEVVVPDPGKLMLNMRSLEPGHDRWNLYRGLAWFLRRFGLDGEACVKRSLCEVASMPRMPGLLGDVVEALFTIPKDHHNLSILDDYYKASKRGRTLGECDAGYSECPVSLYELPNYAQVRWL